LSNQDVTTIASATGTFVTLQPKAADNAAIGKVAPASGKAVPAARIEKPDLEALAKQLNIQSQAIGRDLRFKVDMASGKSVIQVLDRETGEIIREIPPEKAAVTLSASGKAQIELYDGQA